MADAKEEKPEKHVAAKKHAEKDVAAEKDVEEPENNLYPYIAL